MGVAGLLPVAVTGAIGYVIKSIGFALGFGDVGL
jgi:hypothetical protein